MEDERMTFEEGVKTVPGRVKAEGCWRFVAYPGGTPCQSYNVLS